MITEQEINEIATRDENGNYMTCILANSTDVLEIAQCRAGVSGINLKRLAKDSNKMRYILDDFGAAMLRYDWETRMKWAIEQAMEE